MTLYGLDLIIDRESRNILNEINGICSGMKGFREIYGDDRVQEKVWEMLKEKYGKLTLDNGTYAYNQYKKNRGLMNLVLELSAKAPFLNEIIPVFFNILNRSRSKVLKSEKAEIQWLAEKAPKTGKIPQNSFEIYSGQESTIINYHNHIFPHPSINSYVAEGIAGNKFLQYRILKDSEISDQIIKSSLVGLGITHERELSEMLSEHSKFVVKPILGSCGNGVRFMDANEVFMRYTNSRGPITKPSPLQDLLFLLGFKPHLEDVEDLVQKNKFIFEYGISIIQPFIESREKYSVVRAIVCNGKFVDAYQRISQNPLVNLSQDARAIPFKHDKVFRSDCENIVEVLEKRTQNYSFQAYKKLLYTQYFTNRDLIAKQYGASDAFSSILGGILDGLIPPLGKII